MQYPLPETAWRKSSYSSANGQCVEVNDGLLTAISVRDSKSPAGPHLTFGATTWTSFVRTLTGDSFPS